MLPREPARPTPELSLVLEPAILARIRPKAGQEEREAVALNHERMKELEERSAAVEASIFLSLG